ncbi:MAG: ImmA/IrrE family metallo-endopeptidase [Deltaproteobacteria bacterium]|nr:ImmA/IrrE family metallo-endopeptidase [Deltaproteobacteria bacterium]
MGTLVLRVGGVTAWGSASPGVDWTWIDWIEQLASIWPRLRWEQRDPLGLDDDLPNLRRSAAARWALDESAARDREQLALWGFLEAHDLAANLGGIALPSVFLLRQGEQCRVWAGDREPAPVPLSSTLGALEDFVAHASERLARLDDGRARSALARWRKRNELDTTLFVQLATGLNRATLDEMRNRRDADHYFELSEVRNDNELLAVARSAAGHVSTPDMRKLIELVRRTPLAGDAVQAVEALAVGARAFLTSLDGRVPAYEQGIELARWHRRETGAGLRRVDPAQVLGRWGARVKEIELGSRSLEACCVWGPAHGPVVLLNLKARRSSDEHGRRATLAHEIAHLLIDRADALPLAEILGGRAPRLPESRANAFAAELLIPRDLAGKKMGAATPDGARRAMEQLRRSHGASRETIAWQALRSGVDLDAGTRAYLLGLLPEDRRYQVEV